MKLRRFNIRYICAECENLRFYIQHQKNGTKSWNFSSDTICFCSIINFFENRTIFTFFTCKGLLKTLERLHSCIPSVTDCSLTVTISVVLDVYQSFFYCVQFIASAKVTWPSQLGYSITWKIIMILSIIWHQTWVFSI